VTRTLKSSKPEPNKTKEAEEEDQVIIKPNTKETKPQKNKLHDEFNNKNIGPSFIRPRKTNKTQPLRKFTTRTAQKWKGDKPSLSRRPIFETQQVEDNNKRPARKIKPPMTEEIKNTTRGEGHKKDLKKQTEQRVERTRKAQTEKGEVQKSRPDCDMSRPRNIKTGKGRKKN